MMQSGLFPTCTGISGSGLRLSFLWLVKSGSNPARLIGCFLRLQQSIHAVKQSSNHPSNLRHSELHNKFSFWHLCSSICAVYYSFQVNVFHHRSYINFFHGESRESFVALFFRFPILSPSLVGVLLISFPTAPVRLENQLFALI